MTDLRQAAQQALEALESGLAFDTHSVVLQNLRTALAMHQVSEFAQAQEQAEPPPPEWLLIKNIIAEYGLDAIAFVADWKAAQRQWVGLEAEEILDLFDVNNVYGSKWVEFARTVEAKLKEKNA